MKKKLSQFLLPAFIFCFLIFSCSKPKAIQFSGIRNFHFMSGNLSTGIIKMNVALYNPNSFPMKIKETTLQVFINNRPLGEVTQDSLSLMPARDTFLMPISLRINLGDILQKVMALASKDSVFLRANGSYKLGRSGIFVKMPLHFQSKEALNLF